METIPQGSNESEPVVGLYSGGAISNGVSSSDTGTGVLAVDTETTGLAFFDQAFAVTVADEMGSRYFDIRIDAEKKEAAELLNSDRTLVFHNAKFDTQKLQSAGLIGRGIRPFHDTEALAHLLDEHRPKRLKYLARELLGEDTDAEEALKAYCRKKSNGIDKKKDGYLHVPREILEPYALRDAEYTYALYQLLWPEVSSAPDLAALYQMEQRLMWVLLDMEWAGLGVDMEYVQRTAKSHASEGLAWLTECRAIARDDNFNPNSNPQIREYFEKKGYPRPKYDANILRTIEDPMAEAILNLRRVGKLHSTYLLPMLREQKDGVLHPNFRQHGTVTGRMSSGGAEG